MSIPNDQILDALLIYYKNRGVDLVHVLRDPIFSKMDVNSKISFIKRRGDLILKGSSPGMADSEKREISTNALISGISGGGLAAGGIYSLARGAGAAKFMGVPQAAAAAVIGGAVVGGTLGTLSGYMKAQELRDRRTAVRQQLLTAIKSPTLPNQVGVLSSGATYDLVSGPGSEIRNLVRSTVDKSIGQRAGSTGTDLFHAIMSHYNS